MFFFRKKYKVGIALSGGGAKGFAHLGALLALNEAGIYPNIISGVSAGAIIGVLYADGQSPEKIFTLLSQDKFMHFVKIGIPKNGLLKINGLYTFLKKNLKATHFENLKIPLIVAASELNAGHITYFSKGELIKKIVASSSIPVLFTPVVMNNKTYIDGGLFDNMPVTPIRKDCEKVIGVHVNPRTEEEDFHSLMQIAERTFHLAVSTTIQKSADLCDLFIEPPELINYKLLDLSKSREIFEIGYKAMVNALKDNSVFKVKS
ncbi:MAG: patatin-like phospholipase family protein [Bacteroidota bacterium]|nr:patatin-like phospholipase family protein [Bacteroidota bacterium]MDP4273597.1 patatin-like phospholipase family protein [Bacteroidota bacterium]